MSAGSFTVALMVSNASGTNTTVKAGYVTVIGRAVNYYVFSDGVSLYHNFENNPDLSGADTSAQGFYQHLTSGNDHCHIDDTSGINYCWNERSNPVNDNTGSKYWSTTESADSIGANSAEFTFHAGHAWEGGMLFGTPNNYYKVFRSNMSFSRTKWAAFDSCNMLAVTNYTDWESVFNGLHMLMGFENPGLADENIGPEFVERMKGGSYQGTNFAITRIREAWSRTLQHTLHNGTILGAYMYADPSEDDYLPGYGSFTEPVRGMDGNYSIHWIDFQCV